MKTITQVVIQSLLIPCVSLHAHSMIWGSMYLRHMVFTELNADKNDLCLVFYLSLTQLKKYHFLSSIPYHWTILTLFHMKLKKPETFISFFITLDFKISNFYVNLHIYIQITKGKKWLWPNKCLTTEKKIILNVSHNLWVLKLLIFLHIFWHYWPRKPYLFITQEKSDWLHFHPLGIFQHWYCQLPVIHNSNF